MRPLKLALLGVTVFLNVLLLSFFSFFFFFSRYMYSIIPRSALAFLLAATYDTCHQVPVPVGAGWLHIPDGALWKVMMVLSGTAGLVENIEVILKDFLQAITILPHKPTEGIQ